MYSLYVLIKEEKPIYVGITKEIKRRIYQHKRDELKDFDTYIVLDEFETKEFALVAERSVYRFLFAFVNSDCLNSIESNFVFDCRNNWLVSDTNHQVVKKVFGGNFITY